MNKKNLSEVQKVKILEVVNSPSLSFEETKQKLREVGLKNEEQVETLAKVIFYDMDQTKRGQISEIYN